MHPLMRPLAVLAVVFWTTMAAAEGLLPARKAPVTDFLPVDQAFELQPLERRGKDVLVTFRIAPGYYLYRDRFKFSDGSAAAAKPAMPAALEYKDEHFGTTWIYRDRVTVAVPVASGPLSVGFQGCADAGLCYPPQTRSLDLP